MWHLKRGDSSAGDTVAPIPRTRGHGKTREDKQVDVGVWGMQPTTAALTFLLREERHEGAEDIQRHRAGFFFPKQLKKQMAQQLPQGWDVDLCTGSPAVLILTGLGEAGRGGEGLRVGSRGLKVF